MTFLLLSILCSTVIFVVFKTVEIKGLDTFQVIVFNYITACVLGLFLNPGVISASSIYNSEWFLGAGFLGCLFIVIFNVMAWTSQRNGLSVASVATKMSVIIPIALGIYLYREDLGFLKGLGIILALIAVYLASLKTEGLVIATKSLLLPAILFLGSGIIDASIKYIQHYHLDENTFSIFSSTIFFFAAVVGIVILLIQVSIRKKSFSVKNIPLGMLLGIVNFGSIFFLLKTLDLPNFESSTVFTINNVSIVLLTTLIGLVIFKEKLFAKNWVGISLAIVAIILISITI
ncbi:MAG: DMT family transporter [Flavobacteriaceae bacterium]|nr:DMT family transporter [Flavobacteriaceae bacterium]